MKKQLKKLSRKVRKWYRKKILIPKYETEISKLTAVGIEKDKWLMKKNSKIQRLENEIKELKSNNKEGD